MPRPHILYNISTTLYNTLQSTALQQFYSLQPLHHPSVKATDDQTNTHSYFGLHCECEAPQVSRKKRQPSPCETRQRHERFQAGSSEVVAVVVWQSRQPRPPCRCFHIVTKSILCYREFIVLLCAELLYITHSQHTHTAHTSLLQHATPLRIRAPLSTTAFAHSCLRTLGRNFPHNTRLQWRSERHFRRHGSHNRRRTLGRLPSHHPATPNTHLRPIAQTVTSPSLTQSCTLHFDDCYFPAGRRRLRGLAWRSGCTGHASMAIEFSSI